MWHPSFLEFVAKYLTSAEVAGKNVIEVGALDVNVSARLRIERYGPSWFLRFDIEVGCGLDEICDARGCCLQTIR